MHRVVQSAFGAVAAAILWVAPAWADRAAQMDALIAALRVADTVAIMREEGIEYGTSLAIDMIPEADMPSWHEALDRIYDTAKMQDLVETGLRDELSEDDIAPLATFFTSDLGAEIIELELSARRAFLDRDVEDTARDRYVDLSREGARIVDQVDSFIEDSDLIEHNVMGILNSNLMLYRGLADGGAYDLTEEDILLDVWAQESAVREDSAEWIGAYLLAAYQPLDPDDLDTYVALWRTDAGQDLNGALFTVFDRMYEELSYLTGQAVAQQMRGQKL